MNRCVAVHGAYDLERDVEHVRKRGFPNAAGLWLENHRGDYVVGGIATNVHDLNTVDAVAETLRRVYGDRSKFFLNLTFINERRRQLGLTSICENQLPHTV
jgi:hypothetical protein